MSKEKPILEWYEQLPEPIRSQAIENYDGEYDEHNYAESQDDAIFLGFEWEKTNEGFDYWNEIHDRSIAGELNNPIESDLVKAAKKVVEQRNEDGLQSAIDELEKLLKP